jgi:hypothetical protein
VNEWGFRDYRRESVMAARTLPIVNEIAASDVWESINEEQDLAEEGVAIGWGEDAVVGPYSEAER